MRYLGTFAGWILAAVLAVAAGLLLSHNRTLSKQVAAYGAEADAFNRQAGAFERENGELRDRIASLEEQIDRSRDSINALSEQVARLTEGLNAEAGDETGSADEDEMANAADQSGNPFAQMMQAFNDPEFAQSAAEMAVDMQYGDFLQAIAGGDPERLAQLREILTAYLAEQTLLGMAAFNPDDESEPAYTEEQLLAMMREDLGQVLTPEELAQFDEYQAGMEERELRQGIEMQLNMFAGRISEENRQLFADVYMDEAMALGDAPSFTNPSDVAASLDAQLDIFARAYERIAPSLMPEEQAALADFIAQQERMYEVVRRMFEDMLPHEPAAQ